MAASHMYLNFQPVQCPGINTFGSNALRSSKDRANFSASLSAK